MPEGVAYFFLRDDRGCDFGDWRVTMRRPSSVVRTVWRVTCWRTILGASVSVSAVLVEEVPAPSAAFCRREVSGSLVLF